MVTFVLKHWLIVLPTVITGLYLLRSIQQLGKQRQKPQTIPVTIRQKD